MSLAPGTGETLGMSLLSGLVIRLAGTLALKAIDRRGGASNLSFDLDASERTHVPSAPWGHDEVPPQSSRAPKPKAVAINPLPPVKPLVSNLDHPPTSPAAYTEAKRHEERWTREQRAEEHMAAIGHDGTLHGRFTSGDVDGVALDNTDINHIRSIPHGAILTHNHPVGHEWEPDHPSRAGHSFSKQDLAFASHVGAREMRAVTPRHTYSITPGTNGPRFNPRLMQEIAASHLRHESAVYAENRAKIAQGKLLPQVADAQHHHQVWGRVAKELDLDYKQHEHGYVGGQ